MSEIRLEPTTQLIYVKYQEENAEYLFLFLLNTSPISRSVTRFKRFEKPSAITPPPAPILFADLAAIDSRTKGAICIRKKNEFFRGHTRNISRSRAPFPR